MLLEPVLDLTFTGGGYGTHAVRHQPADEHFGLVSKTFRDRAAKGVCPVSVDIEGEVCGTGATQSDVLGAECAHSIWYFTQPWASLVQGTLERVPKRVDLRELSVSESGKRVFHAAAIGNVVRLKIGIHGGRLV